MVKLVKKLSMLNHTTTFPSPPNPMLYSSSATEDDYDAATVSGIVFGIFMALLTLYTLWQQIRQRKGIIFAKQLLIHF